MARPKPTLERVQELIEYDPNFGTLLWKPREGNPQFTSRYAGKPAGSPNAKNSIMVSIDCRPISALQICWLLMKGEWCESRLHPENGNASDLRWSNIKVYNPRHGRPAKPEPSKCIAPAVIMNSSGQLGFLEMQSASFHMHGVYYLNRDPEGWNVKNPKTGKKHHYRNYHVARLAAVEQAKKLDMPYVERM